MDIKLTTGQTVGKQNSWTDPLPPWSDTALEHKEASDEPVDVDSTAGVATEEAPEVGFEEMLVRRPADNSYDSSESDYDRATDEQELLAMMATVSTESWTSTLAREEQMEPEVEPLSPGMCEGQKEYNHPGMAFMRKMQPEAVPTHLFKHKWPEEKDPKDNPIKSPVGHPWHPYWGPVDFFTTLLVATGATSKRTYNLFYAMCQEDWFIDNISQMRAWNVTEPRQLLLPVMDLYVAEHKGVKKNDQKYTAEWAFNSLFDLMIHVLRLDNNLANMTFRPRYGPWASEMFDGIVARSSPLFTFPYIVISGERYWLGEWFRYKAQGCVHVGQVISIFEPVDGASFRRGLSATSKRTVDAVLKAAADPEPPLSMFVRRHVPKCGGDTNELVAMWGVEDLLTGSSGPDILNRVSVTYDRVKFTKKRAERTGVDTEYLCEWVNVENAIGASKSGGLVPRKDLPFHPMEQHASHFQLSRMLLAMNYRIPVLRIFLTFYYDDFGAYNRIYRKVGGAYAGFGNLPRFLQDLLTNIMTVTLVPPGVPFDKAMEVFFKQLRELQKGVSLYLGTEYGWVFLIGGAGIFRSDTVESQRRSGHRACTAQFGCRVCKVAKRKYSDATWDVVRTGRTSGWEKGVRKAAACLKTKKEREEARQKAGLHETQGMFAKHGIAADDTQNLPFDVFHSELLGVAVLIIASIINSMTSSAKSELFKLADEFEVPFGWDRDLLQPVPTTDGDSLKNHKGSHVAKLVQVLPFIRRGWITEERFTLKKREKFREDAGPGWALLIQECIVAIARSCHDSFVHSIPSGYERAREMDETSRLARSLMVKLFPNLMAGRQNTHNGLHKAPSSLDYGIPRSTDCRRLETKHACARCVSTNHQAPEVKMMKSNNILMSVQAVTHGGAGKEAKFGGKLMEFINDDRCVASLLSKSTEANTYAEGHVDMEGEKPAEHLILATRGVKETTLRAVELRELRTAYGNRYASIELPRVLNGAVKLYPWMDVAGMPKFQRRIKVGGDYEVWTLRDNETAMDIEKHPYVARVKSIMGHRVSTDADEVFWVSLQWFKRKTVSAQGRCANVDASRDKSTGCPIYVRQDGDRACPRWNTFHTPSDVLRPVHMLHRCITSCGAEHVIGIPKLGAKPSNQAKEHVIVGRGKEFIYNEFFVA